jgi:hypothetical protein
LNNAIQDVHNFIQVLLKFQALKGDATTVKLEQTKLIAEYTAEVVKRGAEETEQSTQMAYGMLKYDDFVHQFKYGIGRSAH